MCFEGQWKVPQLEKEGVTTEAWVQVQTRHCSSGRTASRGPGKPRPLALSPRPLAPNPGASGLRPTWSHRSPSQTAFLHTDAVCLGPCFFPLELQKAASAFSTPRTRDVFQKSLSELAK